MSPPADDARGLAAMLASRADHPSVTADRLAGGAEPVAELRRPVIAHLVEGEQPEFCFDAAPAGIGVDDPEETVSPSRGGVFMFTDRRVYLLLGMADGDKSRSLPYESIGCIEGHSGGRRHRIELEFEGTRYHLWIAGGYDADDVASAVEYASYRHTQATPDTGDASDWADSGPQSVRERLERLGEAHSRGLISTEEFEHRKEELTGE
jgi:hypothetical protein